MARKKKDPAQEATPAPAPVQEAPEQTTPLQEHEAHLDPGQFKDMDDANLHRTWALTPPPMRTGTH